MMDTTRRTFFGTLASLMVAPKLLLASQGTDVIECVVAGDPAPIGARLLFAAEIQDQPLRLARVLGPITRVSKSKTGGVYTIEWVPQKEFGFFMANVEVEKDGRSFVSIVSEPTAKSVNIETRDIETFAPTPVERLSIIITLAKRSECEF